MTVIPLLLESLTLDQLTDRIRDAGFRATLETPPEGRPRVVFGSNGYTCQANLYFPVVPDAPDCTRVVIWFVLRLRDPIEMDIVNQWNRKTMYGRATLLEPTRVCFEAVILLEGGVTMAHFLAQIKAWDQGLGRFLRHLDECRKPGPPRLEDGSAAPTPEETPDRNKMH